MSNTYRISNAAVGKIFIAVLNMARSSEITKEQFHETIFAAYNYIESESSGPKQDSKINPGAWERVKIMIDKAARRSASARAAAARRRERKKSLVSSSAVKVGDLSSATDAPAQQSSEALKKFANVDPEYRREFLRLEREKFEFERDKEMRERQKEEQRARELQSYFRKFGI